MYSIPRHMHIKPIYVDETIFIIRVRLLHFLFKNNLW